MATHFDRVVHDQLLIRRRKLEDAVDLSPGSAYLTDLMQEVDAALSRLKEGSYGLCEACHDRIESDRLAADPLVRFCIDHLSPREQQALQQDLELAARIQSGLLPQQDLAHAGWQTAYHYAPAGPVSGDYCDLVTTPAGLWFMLGDVSGKGVAASMLMAHLHAMFRTLIGEELSLEAMVERASRLFCESTHAGQYATLVCGKAGPDGEVEICNAGHPSPLFVRGSEVHGILATGLPLGMFCGERFSVERTRLGKGDFLLLFTDGLSESQDASGAEFGDLRVRKLAGRTPMPARELVRSCVEEVARFSSGTRQHDDLSLLVLERTGRITVGS